MKFWKRPYLLRRYGKQKIVQGYASIPYQDFFFLMDVQTLENKVLTTEDGSKSVQQVKVFCEKEILVEDEAKQQKADRLWFQEKWFACCFSRLSENTLLRHWTAIFVECLDFEPKPNLDSKESEDSKNEFGGSENRFV